MRRRKPVRKDRLGSGRWRVHGCRSMTCTGRLRSCWRSRPARRGRRGAAGGGGAGVRLYDVHWTPAMGLEKPAGKKGEAWRVGLADGRVLPLSIENATAQRKLALYDVVLVRVADGKGKTAGRAELRV